MARWGFPLFLPKGLLASRGFQPLLENMSEKNFSAYPLLLQKLILTHRSLPAGPRKGAMGELLDAYLAENYQHVFVKKTATHTRLIWLSEQKVLIEEGEQILCHFQFHIEEALVGEKGEISQVQFDEIQDRNHFIQKKEERLSELGYKRDDLYDSVDLILQPFPRIKPDAATFITQFKQLLDEKNLLIGMETDSIDADIDRVVFQVWDKEKALALLKGYQPLLLKLGINNMEVEYASTGHYRANERIDF